MSNFPKTTINNGVRLRPRVVSLLITALAVLVAATAAPARASFSAPVELSLPAPAGSSLNPRTVIDSEGDAIAVWQRVDGTQTRIEARQISHTGAVGPTKAISAGRSDQPQVASDVDGDAVIVWSCFDGWNWRIRARLLSRYGALGPVMIISTSGADARDPQVATDRTGDTIVVWKRYDGANWRVQSRRMSGTPTIASGIRTLSAAGQDAHSPQIANDVEANAVAVWERGGQIEARQISRFDKIGPVKVLSAAGDTASAPLVNVDADGDALAVWQDVGPDFFGIPQIATRRIVAGGQVWNDIVPLSETDPPFHARRPAVASDSVGDAVVAWEFENVGGLSSSVHAQTLAPGNSTTSPEMLSAPGQEAFDVQLAKESDVGYRPARAVWVAFDGTNYRIQTRTFGFNNLSAIATLSPSGRDASAPDVAFDKGQAFVVWQQTRPDGTQQVLGSRGP